MKGNAMTDRPTKTPVERESQETRPTEGKTFTEKEVQKMIAQEKEAAKQSVRQEAINAMATKQAELKNELLTTGQDQFFNIQMWEVMRKMADDMVKSNALPRNDNAYTVMMKMQAGREMGLKPIESLKAFYIVNGVLSIFGDMVVRRLREHGWRVMPYQEKQNSCTATIRKDEEEYSETFTFEEAEKSGWTKSSTGALKPGWIDGINRRRKLRYGAISTLIKTYIPEVLGAASDIAEVAEDTIPLYAAGSNGNNGSTTLSLEESNKPATAAQIENIKNIINYEAMEGESMDYWLEQFETMTYGQAIAKTKELMQKKK